MQKLVWQNANGVELDLTSGNYGITEWEGFSNASLNIQSQQVPFEDGGVFLDALIEQRELSVTLAIQDNNDLELRYQQRRELISALNPKLGEGYLIYTNDFISKRIKCVPQIPLFETHNSDTVGTPKASLSWTACSPYWEDLEENVVEVGLGEQVQITNNGDIPTQVQIEIENENAENMTITNKDAKIRIEGKTGTNVVINTNLGRKQILEEQLKLKINRQTTKDICIFENDIYICGGNYISVYTDNKLELAYTLSTTIFQSITYAKNKNMLIAVGTSGKIVTSNDGKVWTEQTSGVSTRLNCVCYNEDTQTFLIVGASGLRLVSTDAIIWTSSSGGESITTEIIYCSPVNDSMVGFMALLSNGSYIQQEKSNGSWWKKVNANGTNVKGTYSPQLNRSVWTYTQSSISYIICFNTNTSSGAPFETYTNTNGISTIVWDSKQQEYIGLTDTQVYKSEFGDEWELTDKSSGNVTKYVYNVNQNLYYGVPFKKSVNMDSWEDVIPNAITSLQLQQLEWCEFLQKYILLSGANLEESEDGENWSIAWAGTLGTGKHFAISEELENICIRKQGNIYTTTDLQTFTKTLESSYNILFLMWFDNKYQAIANVSGNYKKTTSVDGINWSDWSDITLQAYTTGFIPDLATINDFVTTPTRVIFCGDSGQVCFSENLSTIYRIVSGQTYNFYSCCYFNEKVFMSGANVLCYTINGETCNSLYSAGYFYYLTSYQGMMFGVKESKIQKSSNGFVWEDFLEIPKYSTSSVYMGLYVFKSDKLLINSNLLLLYTYGIEENIIQKLSNDSTMNFNLETGENLLQFTASMGEATAKIKFRQKYIGV